MNGTSRLARALTAAAAVTLMTIALAPVCLAQGEPAPSLAPVNPAFDQYLRSPNVVQSDVGFEPGLIPEPIDLSHLTGAISAQSEPVGAPVSYDLRPLNKLTAVRNQGSCGSCWDFAAHGSLESYLMPSENLDFSENNLKNLAGFDIQCCSGGNRTMSTAYFARWDGPVAESDDPYNPGSCSSPQKPARKHVQDVIFVPNRASALDNEAIKQAVMTYGAVYTTYYHSDAYYNSSTAAYYYNGGGNANHAVCIVGWDDNFPASKFRTPPPGNGAFLIRNSWGSWWGMSGYFWMSYYDSILGKTENAVFMAETNGYDTVYQYDTLGWIGSAGYGNGTAWFANVFTATGTSTLQAASTYVASPNASYELRIYLNPTSGPIGGTLATIQTGTIDTAGYHTIKLNTPVGITAGQKFSVVIKLTTPGYGYAIPLERPYSGYSSKATASPGQSYMSSNGTSWTDVASTYSNTNVCLKAFAGGSSTPPAQGSLSVSPATNLSATGDVGGPFSPSSQAYTLTNTGGSSINWTASKMASWITLSATGGTLAAGASTTVTISIASGADSLAAGGYSDTVTFANATNGSGSTTRTVSLTVTAKATDALSVTPETGLASSGNVGGPFSPASQNYTLSNTTSGWIFWRAAKTASWVTISAASGWLPPKATATVTASINYNANYLTPGTHTDTLTFTNVSNGGSNTTRTISLTVGGSVPAPGALSVGPTTGLTATGNVGGPFSPSGQVYTLTNTGGSAINWTASKAASWITLSATGGTLAAGASATVTVSINSSANALGSGTYSDAVTFANTTNGAGNATRTVTLTVNGTNPPPPAGDYSIVPAAFGWIDPTAHTTVPLQDNNYSYVQTIPFNFTFYGKVYNRIYVGSNGLMGFSPTGLYGNANTNIPSSYYPNAAIYPYWDDLNPAAGGYVKVGTVGYAPNRRFVVSWVGVPSKNSYTAKFSFQAILEEATGDIVFQYLNVSTADYYYGAGRSATVGIENETGTDAAKFSFNSPSIGNQQAIRFTNLPTAMRRLAR